ncbi:unnamed protein product, partial [Symbiodinium necroappetens]
MREFALYARLRAAQEEMKKQPLRAGGVRLLVTLELLSMLCYIQVATLTNAVFLAVPFVLLLVMAMVRHQGPAKLVTEPLYVLWPHDQSRLGLLRQQISATRFVACGWSLKLACCVVYWARFTHVNLLPDICPARLQNVGCDGYSYYCAYKQFKAATPSSEQMAAESLFKQLYEAEDSPCWHDCNCGDFCLKETYVELGVFARTLRCDPLTDQTLECCQCLHCQLSVPGWLQAGCKARAYIPETPRELFEAAWNPSHVRMYSRNPYYIRHAWHLENAMLAQLSFCVLTHNVDAADLRIQVWRLAMWLLQLLPSVALAGWLLLSLALPRILQQDPLCMLGQAASDTSAIEQVDAKAQTLRADISHKRLKPTLKERVSLYMGFAFFLLDYASDFNCLARMVLEQKYSVAIAQAVMIVLPIVLDCYRGKIQVVE